MTISKEAADVYAYPHGWSKAKEDFRVGAVVAMESKYKRGNVVEVPKGSQFRAIAKSIIIHDALWALPSFQYHYMLETDVIVSDTCEALVNYSVVYRKYTQEEIDDLDLKEGVVYLAKLGDGRLKNLFCPEFLRIPESDF